MQEIKKTKRNNQIKKLYATGKYSLADLAKKYGVHRQRIYMIIKEDKFNGKNRRRARGNRKPNGYSELFKNNKNICVFCGSEDELTADHITPLAKGGLSEYSNLQILCRSCNIKKSDNVL